MKWEAIHPEPGKFAFEAADRFVAFGEKNHMFIVGHTLVWHNQTPKWVFQDDKGNPLDREALLREYATISPPSWAVSKAGLAVGTW